MIENCHLNHFIELQTKSECLSVPSKTILLEEGKVADKLYLVRKGCLRLFFYNEGKDITFQFFFEGNFVASFDSLYKRTPSLFFQESLVSNHHAGIHLFEQDVVLPTETQEAVQGGRVGFGRTYLADLLQLLYEFSGKSDKSSAVHGTGIEFDDLIGGICHIRMIKPCDNLPKAGKIACQGGIYGEQIIPAPFFNT